MANTGTVNVSLNVVDDKGPLRFLRNFGDEFEKIGQKGQKAFDNLGDKFTKAAQRSKDAFNDAHKNAEALWKKAGPLLKKGATRTAGVVGGAITVYQTVDRTAKDAVRLQEASSKYNDVFKGRTDVVDEWMKDLRDNYAMSTREAKSHLSSTQALFASTGISDRQADGFSHRMVKHAADLGSYYNRFTEHFVDAFQSAVLGDYMAFKKHGIDINSEMVRQQALDMNPGRTADTLTQAEKAHASYLLILEKTSAAVGDMEKNSDSYKNRSKRFNAELEDLSAAAGGKVLWAAKETKGVLTEAMDTVMDAFEPLSSKEKQQSFFDHMKRVIEAEENFLSMTPDGSSQKELETLENLKRSYRSAENANNDPDIDYGQWDDALEREARLENLKTEKEAESKIIKAAEEENLAQKKKYREDELKNLQETNREKYKIEIELAKNVQEDTWLIRDRGFEAAEEQHGETQIRITDLEYAEGARVMASVRTETERFADELERLKELHDAGAISLETYNRAVKQQAFEGFTDAPQFMGTGGDAGEASMLNSQQAELDHWYTEQLNLLAQYRQQKSDLNSVWDEREARIRQQHEQQLGQIEQARQQLALSSASAMFGSMAEMTAVFAGEQSEMYKVMFAASKGFAIAEASIKLWQAVADAGASKSYPANLAAMASVAAAMGGLVANIAAIGMAHDGIDEVPKSGTWLLEKGERVVTEQTSKRLDWTLADIQTNLSGSGRSGGGGSGPPPMNIIIQESARSTAQVTQSDDGMDYTVIIQDIERELSGRMDRGTGLAAFFDRRYGRRF